MLKRGSNVFPKNMGCVRGSIREIFSRDSPTRRAKNANAGAPRDSGAKARRGALINFTGIDSAYEPPISPEVRLDALTMSAGRVRRSADSCPGIDS